MLQKDDLEHPVPEPWRTTSGKSPMPLSLAIINFVTAQLMRSSLWILPRPSALPRTWRILGSR